MQHKVTLPSGVDSPIVPPTIDFDQVVSLGRALLIALGEDPDREGLIDTPRRWASWWKEFIEYQPGNTETTFEAITHNQLVVVSGMRVYSLCEHHLLPFSCDISIAYLVKDQVLGLSKFARIAQVFAHRLQIQERLIQSIADEVQRITDSADVAVIGSGVHSCMSMRGIRTDATVSSLTTRGAFESNPDLRADFMRLVTNSSR